LNCGLRNGQRGETVNGASRITLFVSERQEAQQTGFFYCFSQLPLVFSADAGSFKRQNLGLAGNKPTKQVDILIINFFDFLLAKKTVLGHKSSRKGYL